MLVGAIEWRGKGKEEVGLDKKTGNVLVEVDPAYFRPTEVDLLLGDPTKARTKLGWKHRVSFADLITEMVQSDLAALGGKSAKRRLDLPKYDLSGKRVWVAGHRGMVGAAILRRLQSIDCKVLTATKQEVDLRRQAQVEDWVAKNKPDAVFVAAATVGGILANDSRPAEFLYDNLVIETNVIEASHRANVREVAISGIFLHLPATGAAANS